MNTTLILARDLYYSLRLKYFQIFKKRSLVMVELNNFNKIVCHIDKFGTTDNPGIYLTPVLDKLNYTVGNEAVDTDVVDLGVLDYETTLAIKPAYEDNTIGWYLVNKKINWIINQNVKFKFI